MDDKDKIDKLIDKLIAIHDELQTETMHKDIVKKYNLYPKFIADFQYVTDMDKLRENIEFIIDGVKSGKDNVKIAADLGYGLNVLTYIIREMGYGDFNRDKAEETRKIENVWKCYKFGEMPCRIAKLYGLTVEETEFIINNFERRVNKRRKRALKHELEKDFDREAERESIRGYMGVSDEIIDYIVDGKPLSKPDVLKGVKIKNMGDVDRDEL